MLQGWLGEGAYDDWLTGGIIVIVIAGLTTGRFGADLVVLAGLAALIVLGIITPGEAVAGFANTGVWTVVFLYVVVAGLKHTGALNAVATRALGRPKTVAGAQIRLIAPVAFASAFLNNTPIVAMFLPVLSDWARRNRISPAMVFMPLSFAAVLGGMCTLIGTSTNLVVQGMILERMDSHPGLRPMGMFTLTWIGVPVTVFGAAYMCVFGRRLLKDRTREASRQGDPREYMTTMRVARGGGLSGQTVEQAGLRHLPGLYLSSVERGEETILAVGPEQVLREGDVLVFVGNVGSVADLQKIRGLEPVTSETLRAGLTPRHKARLVEAVVSKSSPLLGVSIREGEFRTRYGAVVIAVHRAGERVTGKIGDIRLREGDTLLLEAPRDFLARFADSQDFYLLSEMPGPASPRHALRWIALAVLVGMVLLMTVMSDHTLTAALAAALGMVLLRCCTGPEARASIDWQVFLVIGAAFGIGRAMEKSGLAGDLAGMLLGMAKPLGYIGALAAVYALAAIVTEVITNNAAAVLSFPIALQVAEAGGWDFMPFAVVVAIASSAGFATPIGYQTNLMVMGPGGYRPVDFLRFGLPLTVLCGVVAVTLTPLVFAR